MKRLALAFVCLLLGTPPLSSDSPTTRDAVRETLPDLTCRYKTGNCNPVDYP